MDAVLVSLVLCDDGDVWATLEEEGREESDVGFGSAAFAVGLVILGADCDVCLRVKGKDVFCRVLVGAVILVGLGEEPYFLGVARALHGRLGPEAAVSREPFTFLEGVCGDSVEVVVLCEGDEARSVCLFVVDAVGEFREGLRRGGFAGGCRRFRRCRRFRNALSGV